MDENLKNISLTACFIGFSESVCVNSVLVCYICSGISKAILNVTHSL